MAFLKSSLLELHGQIRDVVRQIEHVWAERRRLAKLWLEFNRLALDKLALDAVKAPNGDMLSGLRVVGGRVQAAAQYFSAHDVPLLAPRSTGADLFVDKPKASRPDTSTDSQGTASTAATVATAATAATVSVAGTGTTGTSTSAPPPKRRRLHFALSRSRAARSLDALRAELAELLRANDGLGATVKRFREDIAALRSEISAMRRFPESMSTGDEFWLRLANVGLGAGPAGARRASVLGARRLSTASVPPDAAKRFSELKQNWDSCSLYARRQSYDGASRPSSHAPLYTNAHTYTNAYTNAYTKAHSNAYVPSLPLGRTLPARSRHSFYA